MFVQIIRGRVPAPDAFLARFDRWQEELRPGATGFLGSTAGVSPDGDGFLLARFESEEAAEANSERPEQGRWWEETARTIESPTFTDSTDVTTFLGGGSDEADFVQVIDAKVAERDRFEKLFATMETELPTRRPDLLGGLVVWQGGDSMTHLAYFTNEAEAREHEAVQPEDEAVAARLGEWRSLMAELTFTDLTALRLTI